MSKIFTTIAACLAIAGCVSSYEPELTNHASHGPELTQQKLDHLVVGQTTPDEAIRIFGQPMAERMNSDGSTVLGWGYARSTSNAIESQGLSIAFDRHGKMSGFSMTDMEQNQ